MILTILTAICGIFATFDLDWLLKLDVLPSSLPLLAISLICVIVLFCSSCCCKLTYRSGFTLNSDKSVSIIDLETTEENQSMKLTEVEKSVSTM